MKKAVIAGLAVLAIAGLLLVRNRVARTAIAGARLDVLGASAATPGFTAAFLRLADELTAQRVDPDPQGAAR